MTLAEGLATSLSWGRTGEADYPYAASLDGRQWRLRLNDFPAEPLYTLFIDGREIGDFDDWPACWRRPA